MGGRGPQPDQTLPVEDQRDGDEQDPGEQLPRAHQPDHVNVVALEEEARGRAGESPERAADKGGGNAAEERPGRVVVQTLTPGAALSPRSLSGTRRRCRPELAWGRAYPLCRFLFHVPSPLCALPTISHI